ncbi:MAG TPA: S-adenosylmethionine decarboxylase [Ramlibacter sp.]|jgi:S-adenosylmethionine decarboxylase|nr:S-adenosylmethionine decarboxylase [Ramlibacter sp.]
MKGLHLTADLYRCHCEPRWLADGQALQAWCATALEAVGLRPVAHAFHQGATARGAGGVSGSILASGAHLCLHTLPAEQSVSLDVYVRNDGADLSAKARGLMFALVQRFQPEWTEQRSLDRGEE